LPTNKFHHYYFSFSFCLQAALRLFNTALLVTGHSLHAGSITLALLTKDHSGDAVK
jgi:hypothetical protein